MKTAVRAFNRIFNPINESIGMGASTDGEFSGEHYANLWDSEYVRVAALVAERFRITENDLVGAVIDDQTTNLQLTQHAWENTP